MVCIAFIKVLFSRFSYISNRALMEFLKEVIKYWGMFLMGFNFVLFLVFQIAKDMREFNKVLWCYHSG